MTAADRPARPAAPGLAALRLAALALSLALVAGCGLRGDPQPPAPEDRPQETRAL